jgi:hypothetical protein
VTTGFDGNYLKDFWLYDPHRIPGRKKISMGSSKRSGAVAFVHDNKAYIVTEPTMVKPSTIFGCMIQAATTGPN